jgi:hypothetical protein
MTEPKMPSFSMDGAIKCRHCDEGFRHPVGNCVLCGYGPAPGAVDIPTTEYERAEALARLAVEVNADRHAFPFLFK